MNPQQPYYQPPQQQQTPNYNFIMAPQQSPKRSLLPTGNSTLQRALIALGVLVALIIIISIFVSLVFGGSSGINTQLTSLAARQQELIRVATTGTQQAVNQNTKNLAISVELSLTSDQHDLVAYVKTQGHSISSKELAADQSSQTDTQLTAAVSASTFDSTFTDIIKTELTSYAQAIKTTFAKATGKNARNLLNQEYIHAQTLLKQATND